MGRWGVAGLATLVLVAAVVILTNVDRPWEQGETWRGFPSVQAEEAPVSVPTMVENTNWPQLFGPTHDAVCTETGLKLQWPDEGPPKLWELKLGTGYSAPAIQGEKIVLFHRVGDEEIVECRDLATSKTVHWRFAYPTRYVDRYGYNGGPRCTPIISGDWVYTLGAEGRLHCLAFETGAKKWERNINEDYQVEQGFFGVGATPLLEDDRLIINVGGKKTSAGIAALATTDGKTLWTATDEGASYATPRGATIHGQRHVFVFTEAGLVDIEPKSGKARWSIPFRSKLFESVNATSPLVSGDLVFVSATYGTGALALRVKPDGSFEELWRDKEGRRSALDSHFSNIIEVDGYLYGYAGRHENGSTLRCVELKTGKVRWRWETLLGRGNLVRVGQRFLLWGEQGHLVAIDVNPEKVVPRAITKVSLLEGPTWTPPAIAGGRLFLRNESRLICLNLR